MGDTRGRPPQPFPRPVPQPVPLPNRVALPSSSSLPQSGSSATRQYTGNTAQDNAYMHNGDVINIVTTRNENGITEAYDRRTQVHTKVQTSPIKDITDAALRTFGIWAVCSVLRIDGTPDTDRLFPSFRKREDPESFFAVGRVFTALWITPEGVAPPYVQNFERATGSKDVSLYSETRRFVVVKTGENYCSCIPIVNYNYSGGRRSRIKLSEHSIIHTTQRAPNPTEAELPRRLMSGMAESGLLSQPIRVHGAGVQDVLDQVSRIDYGSIYTISHDIKVRPLGVVAEQSMVALSQQFRRVWAAQVQGVDIELTPDAQRTDNKVSLQTRIRAAVSGLKQVGYTDEEAAQLVRRRLASQSQQSQQEASNDSGSNEGDDSSDED